MCFLQIGIICTIIFMVAICYINNKTKKIKEFTVNVFINTDLNHFSFPENKRIFQVKSHLSFRNRSDLHADPFLFVHNEYLYLFMEEAYIAPQLRGEIKAYRTNDLKVWKDMGIVLKESCHLSFPFIFNLGNDAAMIPETGENGVISIYKTNNFPYDWKVSKTLLYGKKYLDSHMLNHNGIWYLFTNEAENQLNVYFSDSIDGEWESHPNNPIVTGFEKARSAGSIIKTEDGRLLRPAQDCSSYYGRNFSIYEITELTTTNYSEILFKNDVIDYSCKWNEIGGHHISSVIFNGKRVTVLDGLSKMSLYNRIKYYIVHFFVTKFKL